MLKKLAAMALAALPAWAHTVNADYLNVRSGPGFEYAVVELLSRDDVVNTVTTSGAWTRIDSPHAGWAYSAYLSPSSHARTVSAPGGLNVRSGPGTSYSVVTTLSDGARVTLWGATNGWGEISQGWVSSAYLVADSPRPSLAGWRPAWATAGGGLNVRSGAGTGHGVLDIAPNFAFLALRGPESDGWWPVSHHATAGWCSAPYVTVASLAPGAYAWVVRDGAPVRAAPSGETVASAGLNAVVRLLGESGGWWQVDGGWMAAADLAPSSTAGAAKLFAWPGTGEVRPMGEFSQAIVDYIGSRAGTVGVSIYDNRSGRTYAWNGDWRVRTASIVKVPIMMTVMDRAVRQGRGLTDWERSRIEPMIRWSSNAHTTELWNDLGGWPAVASYLRSIGVTGLSPDPAAPGSWGYVLTSANDFTRILAKLCFRQTLRDDLANFGLHQMTQLIEEHRDCLWYSAGGENWYAVKGGYYPESDVIRVHDCGIVDLADDAYDASKGLGGTRTYVISVLTRYPSGYGYSYGAATVRRVSELAYQAVLARR